MMYRAADLSCVRMISSIIADAAPPSEKAELVLDELFRLILMLRRRFVHGMNINIHTLLSRRAVIPPLYEQHLTRRVS